MKILVISNNYPSESNPTRGVFVYNLVQQFANIGHELTIISPVSHNFSRLKSTPVSYGIENGAVYRPKFFSFSAKKIGPFNTYRLTELAQIYAVKRIVTNEKLEFDCVYCHFLTNAIIAINALKSFGKPVFAAIGESSLESSRRLYEDKHFKKSIMGITGFIAVSNKLKSQLIEYGVKEELVLLKPNGVDFSFFYPRDKFTMRKKHNLPINKKIIVFVGRFMEHKGPLRVLEAVKNIKDVGLVFIGSGPQDPSGERVVFKGKIPSHEVSEFLSAADVFVLPTLREGSCNAIVEAMACALPIVSSNIPEVIDQCDPTFSILVDPLNVSKIRNAINEIFQNDTKRQDMSDSALAYSKKFEIKQRAIDIIAYMENLIK